MKKKVKIFSMVVVTILIIGIYLFLCLNYFLYPLKYKDNILNYSQKYNLKPELVASLIYAESKFDANAISNKGAKGLMQIMPQTAMWICIKLNEEYKEENLFDADYNIKLGTYYLSYLSEKFEDVVVILCAYNAGEGVVNSWLKDKNYSSDGKTLDYIPFKQTREYTQKVINNLKRYEKKFN